MNISSMSLILFHSLDNAAMYGVELAMYIHAIIQISCKCIHENMTFIALTLRLFLDCVRRIFNWFLHFYAMRCNARTSADSKSGIPDCGVALIPVLHRCSFLRSTAQLCVPLESIRKCCVWSTSGFLNTRRFPADELTCSAFWVPHTMPSKSHSSLSYLVWQSGEAVKSIVLTWYTQETLSATLSIRA